MKTILLAAAALIAMPALAQTQSGTSMPDSATPATPATPPPADAMQTAPAAPDTAAPAPMGAQTTGTPVGGYQPAGPAMTGAMTPGVAPIYRQAPSPSEAYPAPAPLASYPMCRPGQFDQCMQGPHSTHSRQVRRGR